MTTVRTILVPVDFTEGSYAALRHARDLSAVFNSNIHLLHVASGPDSPAWALELFGSHVRPLQEQQRLKALDQLATLIVSLRLDPFSTTGLVRTGRVEQVIAEYADEIHADLIVMGLHGECAAPAAVGHVVERVLGRVTYPVLTIPEQHVTIVRVGAGHTLEEEIAC